MNKVAVIGAGPAGLMAAEVLSQAGAEVTVYDRMPSAGRKFLMAGRGGLNLTHSEELAPFLGRYGTIDAKLQAAVEAFPPAALRAWCEQLGQPTFVGTSGRVFPTAMKASPLLRAWLRRLDAAGVKFSFRHRWTGWDDHHRLSFATCGGNISVESDATVLALGGASWPRLGSDGSWAAVLSAAGVGLTPLKPSNSGFLVSWSDHFRRHAGQPLKRIALSFGGQIVRGEAIVTAGGIEGGAVYALSSRLRDALDQNAEAILHIVLRPDIKPEDIERRLTAPRGKQSISTYLRKTLSLSPVEIGLLQEVTHDSDMRLAAMTPFELARLVNAVPIRLAGIAPIIRAISTAGGVGFDALDLRLMLKALPGIFIAGEMLDWEAPTGGYLLQACFASGFAAARGVLEWMDRA